ncbi:hypothetical protein [Pseudorhodoplanes sinuspersici]|uniref:Uncharacterized protein n=1 Tax=Pseudorhodoplanes sinuspersici TaxID=1235591 RepID=A0A1W6ZLA0_9HYPH|nr:hypothetical protein [Pseudorhodoplanes sinuspersici]ARP98092.1 hypothetical protein CAK95_02590 [Pseudorhodoplanes sinuspersici]RKE68156.1 hypothetical protein DFP91_4521 [Pseudorhodoplanes sinuspersici]
MFDIAHRVVSTLRSWVRDRRYRVGYRLAQWRRAWRYAIDSLSPDDAQRMMLDCRGPAGWHPLLVLTVEDTLEQAREELTEHPELPRLLADGCARVADKWESYNDELWEARRWAINLAREYAADEGITLTALDDEREPAS